MRILAFDTATEWCTAALWLHGELRLRETHAGQRHSELLLPMIRELLAEAGLQLRDLDGLAYGMGPGAFTGLRIACGVAQGLALGADLPVWGVSTLEALAEEARLADGATRVMACLDARMGEVYVGQHEWQHDCWRATLAPRVCPPALAPELPPGRWHGIGSGFAAHPELQRRVTHCNPHGLPHARAIARLAVPAFQAGRGLPAEQAEPLYIRDKVALRISERASAGQGGGA